MAFGVLLETRYVHQGGIHYAKLGLGKTARGG